MFSDTFTGISPASVPMFIVFQILGAAPGSSLALFLYPQTQTVADTLQAFGSPRSCAAIAARSISDDTAAMRPSRKR